MNNLLDSSMNSNDLDYCINIMNNLSNNNDNINNFTTQYNNILNNVTNDNLPDNLTLFFIKGKHARDIYDIYECAICVDTFQDKDECILTKCKHIYHTKCLEDWIDKNKISSPLCRKDM